MYCVYMVAIVVISISEAVSAPEQVSGDTTAKPALAETEMDLKTDMVKVAADEFCYSDCTFGIYTATLDGKNMKLIVGDMRRTLNHAHVSPDKQWLLFSRFNRIGKDGFATESPDNYEDGDVYNETEVIVCRFDGSDARSLIPPKSGQAITTSCWTDDGTEIVHLYRPGPELGGPNGLQIRRITVDKDMNAVATTRIPVPEFLLPIDPHQVGDRVVFPGVDLKSKTRGLWIMNTDGGELRQLTWPKDPATGEPVLNSNGGENDPFISPDGTKVAFMRHIAGKYSYHIFVVDVATGEEMDLSEGKIDSQKAAQAVPNWSSDGKLLIFWYPDITKGRQDLYTMRPDGTDMKKIPLPDTYQYEMPAFFPGEGFSENARIIFSARKIARVGPD